MEFTHLPENIQAICHEFIQGLSALLPGKLHGVYMYGATVFPDAGPIQDIDCHVVLQAPLTSQERAQVSALHRSLGERFPPLGGEIDAYYILYRDAVEHTPPPDQLHTGIRDESWALHCAHVRAGSYLALYGPPPQPIFPAPSWPAIAAALEHELRFIQENLDYPAFCVLNLCRILYSLQERNVVVSKQFSGHWACASYPQWVPLIRSATRAYAGAATTEDDQLLKGEVRNFLAFASHQIHVINNK
jgi:hypothetical protein